MKFSSLISHSAWKFQIRKFLKTVCERIAPEYLSVINIRPGHYYSPLISVCAARAHPEGLPYDGVEMWKNVNLNAGGQRETIEALRKLKPLLFPDECKLPYAYWKNNNFFQAMDAWALSSMVQWTQPRRIVEVGSGFSTAVIADTCREGKLTPEILCIEPYPERLMECLKESELTIRVEARAVQEIDLEEFLKLERGDILFIDSSHVAKPGSDVTWIFLRILPLLASGVVVHIHDIQYCASYPADKYLEGVSWNESIFLRSFLLMNRDFEVILFNDYAFRELGLTMPPYFDVPGASFWMRRT